VAAEPTSYDDVPYISLAFPQTHPERLATTARVFGLKTPPVDGCRVLELGCASGGNLIPMACNLPRSTFVGIDLSRHQVDDAKAVIRRLGLTNVRVEHASITDVDASWGEYDYVICHGVFSWVERGVQDRILEIVRDRMSRTGIAYISYNTYPGWHLRESVRHMMRYHAGQFDTPAEQVAQARALLTFLASASDKNGPYGELLNREVERLGRASDSYLFHEHLEQTNAPLYFHQFIERAEQAGLLYLSEASVSDMLTSHFPPVVAETLERISPDILHLEQYMDFVRNRQFRQTLLCHAGSKPVRALTPAFLRDLLVSSQALPETVPTDLASGEPLVFWKGKQRADVSLPATKAALLILMERWPMAVPVPELISLALERAAPFLGGVSLEDARRGLTGDLFGTVMYGMVQLHTIPLPCTNDPGATPRAHPIAADHAELGRTVVNAHHDSLELDAFSREVLRMCDGTRTRETMLDDLVARFEHGGLTLQDKEQPVTDAALAREILADRLGKALRGLVRSAVLVAPALR
jgi:SAM-dependent methyltransferase